MVALDVLDITVGSTIYRSQNAFDTGVGTLIERSIQSATTEEKVVAFRTRNIMTAGYSFNRPSMFSTLVVRKFRERLAA